MSMQMNHSLVQRTKSAFGEQEWQEIPWIDTDKGVEQVIFDYGLKLGGLLEAADALSKGESHIGDVTRLSDQLAEVSNRVENLSGRYLSPVISASGSVLTRNHHAQQATPAAGPTGLHLKVIALAIQLMACATGYAVIVKAMGLFAGASGSSVMDPMNQGFLDIHARRDWFDNRRTNLALEIHQTSIDYLSNGSGKIEASRVIFPLRLAFEQFEPSSREYLECRALLQKLEGKGREYLPALNRNESVASRIIRHKRPFTALNSA